MSDRNNSSTLPRPEGKTGDENRTGTVLRSSTGVYQPNRNRPASLYDNIRSGFGGSGSLKASSSTAMSVGNLSNKPSSPRRNGENVSPGSPSQLNHLTTTVPQNMTAIAIAGRHAPTRSSLRHSRMIVAHRTGKLPRKYHPPVMVHHKLGAGLATMQLIMGMCILAIASWLFLWTPNLLIRDITFWSAGPLLLSGFFGIFLLHCCRKEYPGMPNGWCVFATKVTSILFASAASIASFCACVFAAIHIVQLWHMNCEPANELNSTCVCQSFSSTQNGSTTFLVTRSFEYVDLNCPEVRGFLPILLIASCASNGIAGIAATWYLFLHWTSRYAYLYSEVRTSENKPIIIPNKTGNIINQKK